MNLIGLFILCIMMFLPHLTYSQISWRDSQDQYNGWYKTVDAIQIADQVLLYQRDIGGWSKNIDMAKPLSDKEKQELIAIKPNKNDASIDNGATFTQIRFLAKVYEQTQEERFKDAIEKGLTFLLDIQYENGGWPQFPYQDGYKINITYNDNAMIGVLELLQDVALQAEPFGFINESIRTQAQNAVEKGIACILKTQVMVDGKKTVWCAQHDKDSLEPAPARSYEHASLSGSESARIVSFLMKQNNPSKEIKQAIEAAVAWFETAKLTGIKEVRQQDASLPKGFDKIIVKDENAPPLWARFYEIGTNKPIFSGRDGIIKYTLAEIEHERRVGYSWYSNSPEKILTKEYPKWKELNRI